MQTATTDLTGHSRTGEEHAPVGVVEAGVTLGGQRADLLPVGDELVALQVDLGGVLGVGLLQALGLAAKSVYLRDSRYNIRTDSQLWHLAQVLKPSRKDFGDERICAVKLLRADFRSHILAEKQLFFFFCNTPICIIHC